MPDAFGVDQGPNWASPPGYTPPGYPPPGAYSPPGYPPGPGYALPSYSSGGPGFPQGNAWMGPQPAGYGARLAGWLLDWVVLAVVQVPLLLLTHSLHRTHTVVITTGVVSHQSGFSTGTGGIAISVLLTVAYGTLLCGSKRGQTLGMMAAGTRAVDQANGGSIGFGRALGRALFEYLMAVLLFIPWVIDMLFPLWDSKKQTLHDKVTRTVVVKV